MEIDGSGGRAKCVCLTVVHRLVYVRCTQVRNGFDDECMDRLNMKIT